MREGYERYCQTVQTPEGVVQVKGPASLETLSNLTMDSGLRAFRPPNRQKEALMEICQLEFGSVVIAVRNGELLGYVTFHPPDSFERWSQGPKEVLELGAIEVAPTVRGTGIARRLLEVAFANPEMENFLVLATEYYWHWDLEGKGLHIWEYRELMRQLMAHVGMVVKDTDEEEIASHPANMLTVRYGKHVSREAVLAFEALLFERPDSFRG
ncbi:MAG: GNAT family N-acetyltransferase [Desulfitobacteriaceae bacterium]|nr:GNAT family N-acetyltransferase [Desulfitobacteriaceae bacterium]MDI6877790.1 GNAT family N-acetyltransferase [Desulfitobacteriaceae bacterium]MDI6912871.1 GNAT family N-acetyltransferase [Desulfitobacteriaceae bacterium]